MPRLGPEKRYVVVGLRADSAGRWVATLRLEHPLDGVLQQTTTVDMIDIPFSGNDLPAWHARIGLPVDLQASAPE